MRTLARGAPILLVLVFAGCTSAQTSSTSFKGDKKAVADVVSDLQSFSQRRQADKICSELLARKVLDALKSGGGDCVREIDKAVSDIDDSALDVQAITITGATAQARVKARRGGRDVVSTLGLVREDRKWQIADFGEGPAG
jgi:hypothetical protein